MTLTRPFYPSFRAWWVGCKQLPKAAVAMKMQAEGVDPAVLDMDPEKPYGTPMSQTSTTQAAPEPAKPMAKPAAAKPALPE